MAQVIGHNDEAPKGDIELFAIGVGNLRLLGEIPWTRLQAALALAPSLGPQDLEYLDHCVRSFTFLYRNLGDEWCVCRLEELYLHCPVETYLMIQL